MENKKKETVDLTRRRPLFLVIGLVMSLSLTLAAFEWKTFGEGDLMVLGQVPEDWDVLTEIPPTVIPPPKPPVIQQPKLIEIPDDEEIDEDIVVDLDIEFNEEDIFDDIGPIDDLEDEKAEEIFIFVEEQASFPGGPQAWGKFLNKNFKYPRSAQRMGIQGKVHLSFVVDAEGAISNIEVIRGIGGGCDEEAIRVLRKSPKWNPGKQRGRPVKSRMAIHVRFNLK